MPCGSGAAAPGTQAESEVVVRNALLNRVSNENGWKSVLLQ
jgi:hypothetical protein